MALENILSTDDESSVDDFIDVPADNTNNIGNQDALQICVNKEVTFDEQNDIFADVFVSGPSENSVSAKGNFLKNFKIFRNIKRNVQFFDNRFFLRR